MKLKQKLEQLRRATPKRSKHGQLYAKIGETRGAWNSITLYVLFRSSENTHLLRAHLFKKSRLMTAAEWSQWFADQVAMNPRDVESPMVARLTHIHHAFVLPGLGVRTQKLWQVQQIIGWIPNAIHKSRPAAVGKRRNKANNKRRARG